MKTNIDFIVKKCRDKYKLDDISSLNRSTSQEKKDIYLALAIDSYKNNPTQDGAEKVTTMLKKGADPFMRSLCNKYVHIELASDHLEDIKNDAFGIKKILGRVEEGALSKVRTQKRLIISGAIVGFPIIGATIITLSALSMIALAAGPADGPTISMDKFEAILIKLAVIGALCGLVAAAEFAMGYYNNPGSAVYRPTEADLRPKSIKLD